MSKFKSNLFKCQIIPRNTGDILFYFDSEGRILCNLNKYTILPNEEYEKLKLQFETGTRNT